MHKRYWVRSLRISVTVTLSVISNVGFRLMWWLICTGPKTLSLKKISVCFHWWCSWIYESRLVMCNALGQITGWSVFKAKGPHVIHRGETFLEKSWIKRLHLLASCNHTADPDRYIKEIITEWNRFQGRLLHFVPVQQDMYVVLFGRLVDREIYVWLLSVARHGSERYTNRLQTSQFQRSQSQIFLLKKLRASCSLFVVRVLVRSDHGMLLISTCTTILDSGSSITQILRNCTGVSLYWSHSRH